MIVNFEIIIETWNVRFFYDISQTSISLYNKITAAILFLFSYKTVGKLLAKNILSIS